MPRTLSRRPSAAAPLLLIAVVAAAARAQAPAAVAAPAAPLARGLESIRTDEILPDVFFIASDELGGRDTPSNGQRVAARFIRDRLQRLGWKPGAPENDWFYKYPLVQRRVSEPATHAVARSGDEQLELELGRDYAFSAFELANVTHAGGVVCCGEGSEAEINKSAVEGKWALVFDSKERGDAVQKRAAAAKAIGLIRVPAAATKAADADPRAARSVQQLRKGFVQFPSDAEANGGAAPPPGAPAPFARITLTAAGRDRLFDFAAVAAPAAGDDLNVTLTEERKLDGDGRIECEDVCGFWPGSDPELSKQVIICSAHYDHVGIREDGAVYHGADDNGSGTCGLLALAEALVAYGPMRRSVMLIWVSGEEKGLFGSRAWSDHPYFPNGGKAIADINMDMIGRNKPDQMLITPTKNHAAYNRLTQLAESFFPDEGFTEIKSADEYYMRSDHAMFARLGIPITFLFDDVHADYHQVTDTADKIDGDKMRRVVRVFLRMLDALQEEKLDLAAQGAAAPAPAGGK
jgi:peptidase M28-like protein